MRHVPGDFAVILPFLFTEATDFFELFQVTEPVSLESVILYVLFLHNTYKEFGTVILQVYFFPPTLAVTFVVPAFFALTMPFLLTVAIFLFCDDHVGLLLVFLIFKVNESFLVNTKLCLLSFAFGAADTDAGNSKQHTDAKSSALLKKLFMRFSSFVFWFCINFPKTISLFFYQSF